MRTQGSSRRDEQACANSIFTLPNTSLQKALSQERLALKITEPF